MSEDVRVLFRELAGLAPFDRENCYARQHVPTVVRDELRVSVQLRFERRRFDNGGGARRRGRFPAIEARRSTGNAGAGLTG